MNWKDKRIKEINHDISETKKKYNFNYMTICYIKLMIKNFKAKKIK